MCPAPGRPSWLVDIFAALSVMFAIVVKYHDSLGLRLSERLVSWEATYLTWQSSVSQIWLCIIAGA